MFESKPEMESLSCIFIPMYNARGSIIIVIILVAFYMYFIILGIFLTHMHAFSCFIAKVKIANVRGK